MGRRGTVAYTLLVCAIDYQTTCVISFTSGVDIQYNIRSKFGVALLLEFQDNILYN